MAKKSTTTEPVTVQAATSETPASGNITIAQLGQRMTKGRKAASASTAATTTTANTATTATSSEQAEADEAKTDLSNPETESSAALTDAAAETVTDGGPGDDAETHRSDEGGEEGAAANDDEEQPKAVRDLQRRVGKLTEQRNEARAKNAELEERLNRLEAGQAPQAPPPHPADRTMGGDRAVQEIDTELAGIEAFLAWADENPDGGTFTEGEKRYDLSLDEIKGYRRKSEAQRIRLNARREARMETLRVDFNQRREKAHAEAVRLYPWVEQKASPEFQEAVALIRENPAIVERPDFELVLARQVAGQRLEREALKKQGKPGGKPAGRTATPVVTFSPTAAPKVTAKDATVSAAEKRFQEGGGKESDLSKLLAQKRLARLEAAKG